VGLENPPFGPDSPGLVYQLFKPFAERLKTKKKTVFPCITMFNSKFNNENFKRGVGFFIQRDSLKREYLKISNRTIEKINMLRLSILI